MSACSTGSKGRLATPGSVNRGATYGGHDMSDLKSMVDKVRANDRLMQVLVERGERCGRFEVSKSLTSVFCGSSGSGDGRSKLVNTLLEVYAAYNGVAGGPSIRDFVEVWDPDCFDRVRVTEDTELPRAKAVFASIVAMDLAEGGAFLDWLKEEGESWSSAVLALRDMFAAARGVQEGVGEWSGSSKVRCISVFHLLPCVPLLVVAIY